jgi:peptidoglycan/xylan/chitin deacetylase (PgdA/CDA1 family)
MMPTNSIKQLVLKSLLLPGFPGFLRYVQRDCATIFMLHRFQDTERGIAGCEISHLRHALAYLTRNSYELVTLKDLFERLGGKGPQARGAVAFTIDDGYIEQATTAAPVFSEFGCPVTTFVSTGFLDGKLWFWWDQIEHVFRHAARPSLEVRAGDTVCEYHWENEDQRIRAQADFTATCKYLSEAERVAAITQLAQASEVEVPGTPPPQFAPMSWDQLRKCEEIGMTFGPHSVSHPVLSRTSHDATTYEIAESWARLRAEARSPVPIFCYPNGEWGDFGDREIVALRRLGFVGAVVAEPGYANALTFQRGEDNRFRVQRFGFPDDLPHMVQYVSGVERLKQVLRGSGMVQVPA